MIRLTRAAEDAGITYRQADYWKRCGYFTVRYCYADGMEVPDDGRMQGIHAFLDAREARVLANMAVMVKAGIKPPVAAAAARKMADTGKREVDLDVGVRITLGAA